MGLPENLRLWPETMIPLPQSYTRQFVHVGDGVILPAEIATDAFMWDDPWTAVTVPDDLYLVDLMRLNLDSNEDIADFASRFGALRWCYEPSVAANAILAGFEPFREEMPDNLEAAVDAFIAESERAANEHPEDDDAHFRRFAYMALRTCAKGWDIRSPLNGLFGFHADEFRLAAHELRDMTRILLAMTGEPALYDAGLESARWSSADDFASAVRWFRRNLNYGLVKFHPRMIDLDDQLALAAGAAHPSDMELGLYAVVCVELYNALVEAPRWRKCALPDCKQQIYVKQRGRSTKGGHRSDSIYCSTDCATTAAKRNFRARKRAQSKGAPNES